MSCHHLCVADAAAKPAPRKVQIRPTSYMALLTETEVAELKVLDAKAEGLDGSTAIRKTSLGCDRLGNRWALSSVFQIQMSEWPVESQSATDVCPWQKAVCERFIVSCVCHGTVSRHKRASKRAEPATAEVLSVVSRLVTSHCAPFVLQAPSDTERCAALQACQT